MSNPTFDRWPFLPYVVPFASFMAFLAVQKYVPLNPVFEYPARAVVLSAILWFFSRDVIDLRAKHKVETAVLGVTVFAIWIGPDMLFPMYRQHWLFQNAIMGQISSPVAENVLRQPVVLWSRIIRAVVLVPIIEELFWRAWLMRWLISPQFSRRCRWVRTGRPRSGSPRFCSRWSTAHTGTSG